MVANIAAARQRIAQKAQKRSAKTASIPAPIGGWNARDPLGAMDPNDAVSMVNMYPLPYDVMVRKGYTKHSTGLPSQVESLMVYAGGSVQKMFAASGTAFYDASAAGAIGAAVVSGLTNARWESTNITTAGGNFMLCVNGNDKLRGYTGAAWWVDGDATHDITGLDTATCTSVSLFKNRVWFTQYGTLKAWYLGTDSIAGAANYLDMQSIARKGGYLVAISTWTIDAGYGVDDMLVCVTSMGEVIVWRGNDPANAVSWSLLGVWAIGSPFATRCMMKWGGDMLLMTYDGLYPLTSAVQSDRLDPRVAITNKIFSAISEATSVYSTHFGWGMVYYAKANMLLLNVPVNEGGLQQQYVMNTITKAWCSFTGLNANCWVIFKDNLFFGGNKYVGNVWEALDDDGETIQSSTQQAFNYFKMRGQTKRWTMLRPTLRSTGIPTAKAILNVDFALNDATGTLTFAPLPAGIWGTSSWGVGLWGSGMSTSAQWQGANAMGYCAGMRLNIAVKGIEAHWASTDYVMEAGSVL